MKLLDLITGPWAILPAQLLELQAIYATHLRGDKIDIDAIEARVGRPLANEQQDYRLEDGGVAVLPIEGVLAPKANLFMRISGGASTQMLMRQVHSLQADQRVRSVVLAVDSPGGSVLGTPALAQAVRELADAKPVVAVSQGTMASAAYWIGSAANAVYIEGSTDQVGSIGVVARHDYEPRSGRISTEITAGRYKRIAGPNAPLSEEGQAYLQQQVDHIYSVFVDAVAAHRGVAAGEVLERMADGRVFIGQQAIDAGLVDGVSTVDAMVDRLASNPAAFASRRKAVFAIGSRPLLSASAGDAPKDDIHHETKGTVMPQADNPTPISRESLERDHAALFAQLRSEFTAVGAAGERERIQAVLAQGDGLPGHDDLVQALAFDGKTTGPEAAVQLIAAERATRGGAMAAHEADAPAPASNAAAPADKQPKTREQLAADAQAHAAEHGVSFVDACKALGIAH